MIDRNDDLPVSRQAKVLGISRGSVYYLSRTVSADDLALMRRIDELHLDYPFAGSWMLQTFLVREGYDVGRLHVATLMKRMGAKLAKGSGRRSLLEWPAEGSRRSIAGPTRPNLRRGTQSSRTSYASCR